MRRRPFCLEPYEILMESIATHDGANAKISAGGSDQRYGLRQDQSLGDRCGSTFQFRREIFALVGVEDGESLEARFRSSSGAKRSAYTTIVPRSSLRTLPPSLSAWRNVS
jgi:hypothetical protein